jgi:branched-chain amino acid aminotransferase
MPPSPRITPAIRLWSFDARSPEPALLPETVPPNATTLDQVSAALAGGAYTTLRTYAGSQALKLDEHLRRLTETARLAGVPLALNEPAMRLALRYAMQGFWGARAAEAPPPDLRLRLTVDLERQPGKAYIAAQPLTPLPAELYAHGAAAITRRMTRQLPEAKLTRFIARSQAARRALSDGINEALMVNARDEITEGLSSNFFAVLGGALRTAGTGVLHGVTRALALENIQALGLRLAFEPLRLAELPQLEEAFITSSSRGVLPLRRIDEQRVGTGAPGSVTLAIMKAFAEAIRRLAEPI